jgi:hypothetical protein
VEKTIYCEKYAATMFVDMIHVYHLNSVDSSCFLYNSITKIDNNNLGSLNLVGPSVNVQLKIFHLLLLASYRRVVHLSTTTWYDRKTSYTYA